MYRRDKKMPVVALRADLVKEATPANIALQATAREIPQFFHASVAGGA
jgi:hypothetical protein